jgi:electron transport complex protein RnfB
MVTAMILEAVLIIGALAALFGFGLAYASRRFAVHTDTRIEQIAELLGGGNCGACGFPTCPKLAEALVKDHSLISNCKVCDENSWLKICGTLGIDITKRKKELALVACSYASADKFEYEGVKSCAAAALISGGYKACKYACLGFGDCVHACPFGAIEKVGYRFFVDFQKCIGCGACVDACPRGLIKVVDKDIPVFLRCNSLDEGKIVRKVCDHGCVACRACEKVCEAGAITVEDNLARIDYTRCTGCGACLEACKFGSIVTILPKREDLLSFVEPPLKTPARKAEPGG